MPTLLWVFKLVTVLPLSRHQIYIEPDERSPQAHRNNSKHTPLWRFHLGLGFQYDFTVKSKKKIIYIYIYIYIVWLVMFS